MIPRIKLRRDTAQNWLNADPILAAGEPGLEYDTGKVKYGDGITAWTGLLYANSGSEVGSFTFNDNTINTTDSSSISFTPAVTFNSDVVVENDLIVRGDVLPDIDLGSNLGSPSKQWNSLYVSNSTIFIGGVPVTVEDGQLSVGGSTVIGGGAPIISETAPEEGALWFNTEESRMYIRYNEQWIDSSPSVLAPPDTNPTLESVLFYDATVQTTAWPGTLSYNDLTDQLQFVGGGSASTWLTAD